MTKLYVFFVLALTVQICLAKSAGAPQASTENAFADLSKQAMDIANSLSKTIKDSLPDSAQVTNVLKDQSQQFADNVKNIVNQLQSGLNENKGVVDDAIKQASQKLSETVKSLQNAAGPEVTARATEIKQKLDENVKSVAQEIDTLVKAVQPQLNEAGERVSSLTKNVLNEFVESARKLQTKVNEAVNNSQAKKH